VQQKLQKNTNLAAKLTSRLPKGTDLMTAADGFRNLGQFVAAVNVSNNLGVSFTALKAKMVDDGMSLGQAIQSTRPTASSTIEAQHAESEARAMIAETETQSPTTTSSSTTTTSKTTPAPTTTTSKATKKKPQSGSNE
jgi:pyruvoyl-dependent arginine decarboxylase (PvlArgDC)